MTEPTIIRKIAYLEYTGGEVEQFLEEWNETNDGIPSQKDYDDWMKMRLYISLCRNGYRPSDIKLIEDN